MPETFALSESAVAVLRFRVKGYRMKVTDRSLEAFRELAAAGIMEPVPGADGNPEADYQFTEDGWARRQELLSEAEERIERERFELPDASNLSEAARELLRRRLAGDREVTDANRPLYRELVAAQDHVSGLDVGERPGVGVPFHPRGLGASGGMDQGLRRRSPSLIFRASSRASCRMGNSVSGACS